MTRDLLQVTKRLLQRTRGYVATALSDVPAYRKSEATGALPGKLMRGAQPQPKA